MIGAMRNKLGPKVIGGIIAVIAGVFIFYGVFTPGGGAQGQGVAGEVNGETISYAEFSRALNQRMEFFRQMMGGKISEAQMEQFDMRGAVFQDLVQKKLLSQIAKKEGFYPSQDQIRDQILKMDAFKKDGHFDKMQYKSVLTANQYTPARFEDLIGQDIMEQNFKSFIGQLAYVSPEDVEKSLKISKDKVKVKYVYLDNESARKLLPQGLKPEEQGKQLNAKVDSISKDVLSDLGKSDAKINSLLKDAKVTVKTSDWLSTTASVIPGVGSIRSIQDELMTAKKGQPAKKYALMGGTFYAMVVDEEAFNPAKVTEKERSDAYARLENQRQSEMLQEFIKSYLKKASVSKNERVVKTGQGGKGPNPFDNN